ncbi:MAG: hypothetical protein NZ473_00535 [Candidatus Kapabacteria bacterium]|nr:hypothetical protein [Candidatus Kapabacteria bacterium]MCS7170504.1 hypothetical protein [Candidatus Kapabacteria bacterium]MDW8225007.1 FapA family protein [Bacteroidota bacterium]
MSVHELPEPLAEYVRRFLLRRLADQEELTVISTVRNGEEIEGGIHPGETRFLQSSNSRIPERLEGVTLVAEGNVVCESDVHNTHLVAAGSVRIEGWCSHAVVVALENVGLRSAVYSHVLARLRLTLEREARFTTLQATEVAADEAVLFGGQIVAVERICVRQLRWAFGEHTSVLSIGTPYVQQLEQGYWRARLREARERLRAVQRELESALQVRRGRPSEQVRRLQHQYQQLQEELWQIEQRSYGIGHGKPVIEVRENVPPDTIVSIHGVIYRVPTELLGVRFTSDGMRIVLEALPESGDGEDGMASEYLP